MSRAATFNRELDNVFRKRSHWLRTVLRGPRPGPPAKLKRRHLERAVAKLQGIAAEAFATALARKEFKRSVRQRKSWHAKRGKGFRFEQRQRAFNQWYDDHITSQSCIYVFWARWRCVYVGRTTRGGRRPSSHFDRAWFRPVTRVDVYETTGRRVLPALECLAIHRFQPVRNKFRAQERRWTRKCPLCALHRDIERELRDIFRFR